jgi:GAF domain-containing protein
MALFSALANDEGYENVFSQQLSNLLQTGDVVIAISGSGNSKNVIRAIEQAKECGAITVGLTGMGGGRLGQIVHLEIQIPSYQIQQVEDLHLMIEHMVVSALSEIEAEQTQALIQVEIPGPVVRSKAEVMLRGMYESEKDFDQKPSYAKSSESLAAAGSSHLRMRKVLEEALASTGAISGTLIMLDSTGQPSYGLMMRNGKLENARSEQLSEVLHHGLAGWVVKHGKAALVGSTSHDPRWLRRNWEERNDTSRSALSIPLTDDNQVIGTLTLVHHQPHRFTKNDLAKLSHLTTSINPSGQNSTFSENR